ncbi:MAG: RNA 2',3'-cyclic phosphodiesterase [Ignavibacteriales bacterium]|nr:RNA 2',3'-cyclic phosphodiesterase [Ignavibacteriales bacterium]
MPSLRCFIALPTPEDVKNKISELQSKLKEAEADVKWDSPEKFHITLKFLGKFEQSTIDSLSSRLELLPQNVSYIRALFNSVGAFPSLQRPKVIWVGIEHTEELRRLQSDIELLCAEFGYVREEREFHPHITLGRVKGNKNLHRLTESLKSLTLEPIQARCTEVLLVRSDLKPSGSVYTTLKSFPLHA